MQEINKDSLELKMLTKHSINGEYILIKEGKYEIYFPKALVMLCDLKDGEYIHFLNDGAEWRFYSNDTIDGFKLSKLSGKAGMIISSAALIRLILKTTGYGKEKKFYITKTNAMHDKCIVYKLSPNKEEEN